MLQILITRHEELLLSVDRCSWLILEVILRRAAKAQKRAAVPLCTPTAFRRQCASTYCLAVLRCAGSSSAPRLGQTCEPEQSLLQGSAHRVLTPPSFRPGDGLLFVITDTPARETGKTADISGLVTPTDLLLLLLICILLLLPVSTPSTSGTSANDNLCDDDNNEDCDEENDVKGGVEFLRFGWLCCGCLHAGCLYFAWWWWW